MPDFRVADAWTWSHTSATRHHISRVPIRNLNEEAQTPTTPVRGRGTSVPFGDNVMRMIGSRESPNARGNFVMFGSSWRHICIVLLYIKYLGNMEM